jgi:hypothetical protein
MDMGGSNCSPVWFGIPTFAMGLKETKEKLRLVNVPAEIPTVHLPIEI